MEKPMYRFVRFRWSWPLLAFLVVLSGCQSASEEDLAQKVKDSESPAEQILASREYLARFSDGARRSEVARTFFEAAVQTGDAQAAAEAAVTVVKGRKGHPLNSARNNVAWTLAEKGLALDTAEQYARAMVEDARKEKSRSLSISGDFERCSGLSSSRGTAKMSVGLPMRASRNTSLTGVPRLKMNGVSTPLVV